MSARQLKPNRITEVELVININRMKSHWTEVDEQYDVDSLYVTQHSSKLLLAVVRHKCINPILIPLRTNRIVMRISRTKK